MSETARFSPHDVFGQMKGKGGNAHAFAFGGTVAVFGSVDGEKAVSG